MDRLELETIRKAASNRVDRFKGSHRYNCVRINPNNSYRHEKAKFDKAFKLAKENHIFMTEALSSDGKRIFDLIDFDTDFIFEFETNPQVNKGGAITVRVKA